MRAADRAASDMHRRYDHLVRRELFHQKADRRDVRDGVERADLMEMDLCHRTAVRMALRFRDALVHRDRVALHFSGYRQAADDLPDISERTVMVMSVLMPVAVLMIMIVVMVMYVIMVVLMIVVMPVIVVMMLRLFGLTFLDPVRLHGNTGSGDAAFFRGHPFLPDPRNADRVQFIDQRVLTGQQLQKGRGQHVAGGSHRAVQI